MKHSFTLYLSFILHFKWQKSDQKATNAKTKLFIDAYLFLFQ